MSYTKKNKLALVAVMLLTMLFSVFVLSGCYTIYMLHTVADAGFSINTIVYTDDYEKYIEGRTVVDELVCGNSTITSGPKEGFWFLETGTKNRYDLIFSTISHKYNETEDGDANSIGYAADLGMYGMTDTKEYTIFENSYIFSGKSGHYVPGGKLSCSTPQCIGSYDSIDENCMGCYTWAEPLTTNVRKTEAEVISQLGLCPGCVSITEADNGDGTYTYTTSSHCSCKGFFYHDGTWTRPCLNWLQISLDGIISSFRFNELILDGYDFSSLYDYITTFDYDTYYTNWEDKYQPSNFSHMFSDLPVEKITIKNIRGLGDRALDFSSMFENCTNLKTIEFGNLFENCKPTNISRMFYNCPNLHSVDLTSLDTSEVIDMSEIFAIGTSKVFSSERDQILEDFINNTLVANYPDEFELDHYTVDLFIEEKNLTKEEVYPHMLISAQEYFPRQLVYPVTYNECTLYAYGLTFYEFYQLAITTPTQVGLAEGSYNLKDIVKHLENTASAYGLNAVYDADLYTNNRTDYVNYVINDIIVKEYALPEKATPYTLEDLASLQSCSKEKLLIDIAYTSSLNIPITIEEAVFGMFGYQIDEYVDLVNQDPSIVDLEPKEDGTPYTKEELSLLFSDYLEGENLIVLTYAEIKTYYTAKESSPRGVLTLGGENSKFVIKEGVDTNNMFGDYCYFATVITPNEIGEDVEISLQNTFTNNDVDVVTKLTAADASKVFTYIEIITDEPEPEPEPAPDTPSPEQPQEPTQDTNDKNDKNDSLFYVYIAIIGGGVIAIGTLTGILIKIIIRKRKPMTIKGQRL